MSKSNLYNQVKSFINKHEGEYFRIAELIDNVEEKSTSWKKYNNNPYYVTRMYVCHLMKIGFLTRTSRDVYFVNAIIPDWCDLGVVWYARGYARHDYSAPSGRNEILYHGKTSVEWSDAVEQYLDDNIIILTER